MHAAEAGAPANLIGRSYSPFPSPFLPVFPFPAEPLPNLFVLGKPFGELGRCRGETARRTVGGEPALHPALHLKMALPRGSQARIALPILAVSTRSFDVASAKNASLSSSSALKARLERSATWPRIKQRRLSRPYREMAPPHPGGKSAAARACARSLRSRLRSSPVKIESRPKAIGRMLSAISPTSLEPSA